MGREVIERYFNSLTFSWIVEIHRMELRFQNLSQEKERLITEMEKAIMKRENIAARWEPRLVDSEHSL